jgi:hypothetical protein
MAAAEYNRIIQNITTPDSSSRQTIKISSRQTHLCLIYNKTAFCDYLVHVHIVVIERKCIPAYLAVKSQSKKWYLSL